MTTASFTRLIGVPKRSYRRWQQRARQGRPAKGPWPTPPADRIEPVAIGYAHRYPQWGSRTIATLMRIDGHHAPDSTVYRASAQRDLRSRGSLSRRLRLLLLKLGCAGSVGCSDT
jgi:hypothetical protein